VKPGLTCYWQISGRNDISFDEWIEMDLRYIREASIWTDIKILFMTVGAVLTGKGAY
jgi:lipopolysaccharide/colanic/teichoic acid biosynthesis glycosyltransferase